MQYFLPTVTTTHSLYGITRMLKAVRTDVRVANLSYIQAGWYIEMMRQKSFASDPMPLTLGPEKYIEGQREQLPVNNRVDKPVNLKEIVQFAGSDDS